MNIKFTTIYCLIAVFMNVPAPVLTKLPNNEKLMNGVVIISLKQSKFVFVHYCLCGAVELSLALKYQF